MPSRPVAISYHHLGILAELRDDYDAAEQRYQPP